MRLLSDRRQRLLALSTWLDSGDRYPLLVYRYLYGRVTSKTPDCRLEATGFLCLRTGEALSDAIMNAAVATLCLPTDSRGTCNVLS
jgi:hypothetical protein